MIRKGASEIRCPFRWCAWMQTSEYLEGIAGVLVNGKTNALGKKTADMAAANDFI